MLTYVLSGLVRRLRALSWRRIFAVPMPISRVMAGAGRHSRGGYWRRIAMGGRFNLLLSVVGALIIQGITPEFCFRAFRQR